MFMKIKHIARFRHLREEQRIVVVIDDSPDFCTIPLFRTYVVFFLILCGVNEVGCSSLNHLMLLSIMHRIGYGLCFRLNYIPLSCYIVQYVMSARSISALYSISTSLNLPYCILETLRLNFD